MSLDNCFYRIGWRLYRTYEDLNNYGGSLIISGHGSRIFSFQEALKICESYKNMDTKNEYEYFVQ